MTQLELNLARDIKNNKKCLFRTTKEDDRNCPPADE